MSTKVNNTNSDSKSNLLHLSFSTSMQSLQSKAAGAALFPQSHRSRTVADTLPIQGSPRRGFSLSQLERQIKNIRLTLERACLSHIQVSISRPSADSSAVLVITIWDKEKGIGAKRTFVFYPSVSRPDRLGSVAIYGSNVQMEYGSIMGRGSLFGLPIGSVSVELGRRPFLDVTFRA